MTQARVWATKSLLLCYFSPTVICQSSIASKWGKNKKCEKLGLTSEQGVQHPLTGRNIQQRIFWRNLFSGFILLNVRLPILNQESLLSCNYFPISFKAPCARLGIWVDPGEDSSALGILGPIIRPRVQVFPVRSASDSEVIVCVWNVLQIPGWVSRMKSISTNKHISSWLQSNKNSFEFKFCYFHWG